MDENEFMKSFYRVLPGLITGLLAMLILAVPEEYRKYLIPFIPIAVVVSLIFLYRDYDFRSKFDIPDYKTLLYIGKVAIIVLAVVALNVIAGPKYRKFTFPLSGLVCFAAVLSYMRYNINTNRDKNDKNFL